MAGSVYGTWWGILSAGIALFLVYFMFKYALNLLLKKLRGKKLIKKERIILVIVGLFLSCLALLVLMVIFWGLFIDNYSPRPEWLSLIFVTGLIACSLVAGICLIVLGVKKK